MNYPTLPYSPNLKIEAESGREFSRAISGRTRGRDNYQRTKYKITIEHTWLNPKQYAEILACYQQAGVNRVTFTDLKTNLRYSAIFENEPAIAERVGSYLKVNVVLVEGEQV